MTKADILRNQVEALISDHIGEAVTFETQTEQIEILLTVLTSKTNVLKKYNDIRVVPQ